MKRALLAVLTVLANTLIIFPTRTIIIVLIPFLQQLPIATISR